MRYLLVLLIASISHATTVDQQIDAAQDSLAKYQLKIQQLQSQVIAAELDTLCLEDSTLAADQVRVIRSNDSAAVNVLLSHLDALDLRSVIVEVKAMTPRELVQVKGDTLYMQHPAARAALPVISAALRE